MLKITCGLVIRSGSGGRKHTNGGEFTCGSQGEAILTMEAGERSLVCGKHVRKGRKLAAHVFSKL
jgi:hypothetical protein